MRKKGRISFSVSPGVKKHLDQMIKEKRKVKVVGRVRRGKLEINSGDLAAFAKQFPNAKIAFVALNAPFKTGAVAGVI